MKKFIIMLFCCLTFTANLCYAGLLLGAYGKMKTFYGSHIFMMSGWSAPQTLSLSGEEITIYLDEDGDPEYYSESMYSDKKKKLYYDKQDEGWWTYKDYLDWSINISKKGDCVQVSYSNSGIITTRVYKKSPNNFQGGSIYSYGSSGSNSNGNDKGNSTYTICRTCRGSGVCTSCGGRGGEWRDTGYYTGSDSRRWFNCPSCNGNKRCFNCHGTGRY